MDWSTSLYDGASIKRSDARYDPRKVKNRSNLMRSVNQATRISLHKLCRSADVGDLPFESAVNIENVHDYIFNFMGTMVKVGVILMFSGGDHSANLPILCAVAKQPLAFI